MPYADSGGVRIYYEVEGEGPPLVMGHGGGDSLEMWRKSGYTDALKEDFQLVLLDFRGHGRSGSPREMSVRRSGMSDDVVAVLDHMNVPRAHYLGYSAGATAGFALALRHGGRFRSFVLGGMTPYAWPETMVKAVRISVDLYRMLLSEPEQYFMRMERLMGRPLTPADREHFLAQDAEARIAGLTSLIDGPELTDRELSAIAAPCLLFCGELDPFYAGAREAAVHMPRVRFLSLPGLNHITALFRQDLVVPYIKEFLAEVSQG